MSDQGGDVGTREPSGAGGMRKRRAKAELMGQRTEVESGALWLEAEKVILMLR